MKGRGEEVAMGEQLRVKQGRLLEAIKEKYSMEIVSTNELCSRCWRWCRGAAST